MAAGAEATAAGPAGGRAGARLVDDDGGAPGDGAARDGVGDGDGAVQVVRPRRARRGRADPAAWWRSLVASGVGFPVGAYLLSRLAVVAAAYGTAWLERGASPVQVLTAWDGGWYLNIAAGGYPGDLDLEQFGNRWAFFPGYPAVVRAVGAVTRLDVSHAAVVASFLLGLAAAVAVWGAVRDALGRRAADGAVVLFVFFPPAVVLSMAYTEGLLVASSAAALWALRRRRWVWAGLAAAVAGATRLGGLVVVGIVGLEAIIVAVRTRRWQPLAAAVVAPLGFLAFCAVQWARLGTPLGFVEAQALWDNEFDWFRSATGAVRDVIVDGTWWDPVRFMPVLAVATLALGCWLLWRTPRVPWTWWAYSAGLGVLALTPGLPISSFRYLLPAFPFFAAAGWALRERQRWLGPLAGVGGVLLGCLALMLFVGSLRFGTPALQFPP